MLIDLSERSHVDRDAVTVRTGRPSQTGTLCGDSSEDTGPATPRSHELAALDLEALDDSDLIFESVAPENDSTPVTQHSPWQRNVPPPLPGKPS